MYGVIIPAGYANSDPERVLENYCPNLIIILLIYFSANLLFY